MSEFLTGSSLQVVGGSPSLAPLYLYYGPFLLAFRFNL